MSQDTTRESFIELMSQMTPGLESPKEKKEPGFIFMVLSIIGLGFVFGLPIMFLWNYGIAGFLPVADMNYLHAVAVFILSKILL